MARVSRREFLAGLGTAALPVLAPVARAAETDPVVVVGAGLSGLAAAFELRAAGLDVRLIEQSSRVGGRIKTVRGHFADDAWVDVGGQTSGGGYGNFFYYSTQFGLEFEPQSAPTGGPRPDILLHLQGRMHSYANLAANPADWPVALHEHERPLAPLRLLRHYLGPVAKEIGPVANVLQPEFLKYDALSLGDFLREAGASDAAIAMIDHTLNYNSVETVSALSALRDTTRILQMQQGGAALNLQNGNSSLPEAFARELGDVIELQTALRGIEQQGERLALQIDTRGQQEVLYAERVVLAIPFTALRQIPVAPQLPASRQQIINELPYTQIVQTYLQTRSRFWEGDTPVAMVVSDGPLERVFNASSRMSGDRGLLINWVNGTGAERIRGSDPDEHLESVLREMERAWPGCRDEIEVTLTQNWTDTYVQGAYAHYAPGQMAAHAADIAKPVGRLHFAGEHTELVAPGMEGALTSGRRAAQEVIDKSTAIL